MNKIYSYSLIVILLLITIQSVNATLYSRSDDLYLNISQQVAQAHNWTYPNYVCRHFSHDLVVQLNRKGYLSSIAIGKYLHCSPLNYQRFRCRHVWVEVYVGEVRPENLVRIESTSGKIITQENYKLNYKK